MGETTKKAASTVVGAVLFVGIVGAAGVAFDHWIMPPHTPDFGPHPSAVDALIDSRLVIGLVRLLAMFLAVYLAGSVTHHMRNRRWLVALWGASAQLADNDREGLQQRLAEAENDYRTLAAEYEILTGLMQQMVEGGTDNPGKEAAGSD